MLDNLANFVQDVIEKFGYLGVALLVIFENLFPPLPSEIILPFAGFVAQHSVTIQASVLGMMLVATLGSVLGALILYGLASWIGPDRLRAFVARHGRWFGVNPNDLKRAEAWFDRRSVAAVMFGRCIPLIRSIVSIPAGFRRMKLGRFMVLTMLGSCVWNVTLIGVGAILGEQWATVSKYVGIIQWLVIVLVIALVVRFLASKVALARTR